jgi:hypothetical protein
MTNKSTRLAAVILFAAALVLSVSSSRAQNPPGGGGQQRPNPFDTGGRDDKPAGEVFKNIQVLKNLPAGQLRGESWEPGQDPSESCVTTVIQLVSLTRMISPQSSLHERWST